MPRADGAAEALPESSSETTCHDEDWNDAASDAEEATPLAPPVVRNRQLRGAALRKEGASAQQEEYMLGYACV